MNHTDSDRVLLDKVQNEKSELQLWENRQFGGRDLEIVFNGVFLMATYNAFSSKAMVEYGLKYVKKCRNIRVLIGGLGMGFSCQEACASERAGEIDVVEIEPQITEWNRTRFASHNGECLCDPRVRVIDADFYEYVNHTQKTYDLICMDIDNGPQLLVRADNSRVYVKRFFQKLKEIAAKKAIFVIWSCSYEQDLLAEMREVGSDCWVEEVLEEHDGEKVPYYLFFTRFTGK